MINNKKTCAASTVFSSSSFLQLIIYQIELAILIIFENIKSKVLDRESFVA